MPARISAAAHSSTTHHHSKKQRRYSGEAAPAYPWQKLVRHSERQLKLEQWKRRDSDLFRYSQACKVMMTMDPVPACGGRKTLSGTLATGEGSLPSGHWTRIDSVNR